MIRLVTFVAILSAFTGCKKKEGDGAAPSTKAAEPAAGCGSDFSDPEQQFCVKLPPGYKLDKAQKEEENSVRYEFQGPEQYFNVLVWGNPQFTYDYQLGVYGPLMKQADHTDVQAGGTTGQTQWWTYKFGTDKPTITALAKSASGMAIQCEGDVPTPAPEVIEACKSLRPYPGGKPRAVPAAGSAGSGSAQ